MNMNDCNAYMLYKRLHELHTPEHPLLETTEAMSKLTYALCQRGESMRKQKAKHPPHMTNVHAGAFATGLGRKIKCTKYGFIPVQHPKAATLGPGVAALHNTKKRSPLETASKCCSRETRKVFVRGIPKFDFEGGKTHARVLHIYALRGV